MDNVGYTLKAKEGTLFSGCYISENNCFTRKIRSSIVFHDEAHAIVVAKRMNEGKPPYEGYSHEDLEVVLVTMSEGIPDLSWLWHCSDTIVNYENLVGNDKYHIASVANKAAGLGSKLTLRKLEDLGIIQLGDIDRSKTEEDQKTFDKYFDQE